MNDVLKSQIIDCIEETCLNELWNRYTGYLGISASTIITHQMTHCGRITPSNFEAYNKRMSKPIDQAQPIDAYFKLIDDDV